MMVQFPSKKYRIISSENDKSNVILEEDKYSVLNYTIDISNSSGGYKTVATSTVYKEIYDIGAVVETWFKDYDLLRGKVTLDLKYNIQDGMKQLEKIIINQNKDLVERFVLRLIDKFGNVPFTSKTSGTLNTYNVDIFKFITFCYSIYESAVLSDLIVQRSIRRRIRLYDYQFPASNDDDKTHRIMENIKLYEESGECHYGLNDEFEFVMKSKDIIAPVLYELYRKVAEFNTVKCYPICVCKHCGREFRPKKGTAEWCNKKECQNARNRKNVANSRKNKH